MTINKETIEAILETPVDELHVQIAKHELQGFDLALIAEIFATDESEIRDVIEADEYKLVKRAVALELAKYSADTDISWDSLEYKSLERLQQTIQLSSDPEFHLRVAAMANKATRRHRGDATPLNPAAAGVRVSLSLTERFVNKLQESASGNSQEQIVERRIDLENAHKLRASPKQVMTFLTGSSGKSSMDKMLEGVGITNAAAA